MPLVDVADELSKAEREEIESNIKILIEGETGEAPSGVKYDPFGNTFTALLRPGTPVDAARVASSVGAQLETEGAELSVIVLDDTEEDARGGQFADGPGTNNCTTGFGVTWGPTFGYTTAGHCTPTTWGINGNASYFVADRGNGDYLDRLFIAAGGASWMTRISPTNEVDMNSTVGHIYINTFICHYGDNGGQDCASIVEVNFRSVGKWTSRTTANCLPRDSGGPVWTPGGGRDPRGFISTRNTVNSDCRYVALDDQFWINPQAFWALL